MKRTSFFLLCGLQAASWGLAGCAPLLDQAYTPPALQTPSHWQQQGMAQQGMAPQGMAQSQAQQNVAVNQDWWRVFNDPELDRLVKEAVARNNDLAAAALKVRQAQLKAGIAFNDQFPSLAASGVSGSYQRTLDDPLRITRSYAATGTVSYEVDLWGRLANASDAAAWEAVASEQDRQSAELSLKGTVVKLYLQAAYLNEKIALAKASVAYGEKTLDLVKAQHETGAASSLEVSQAEQDLQTQKASLVALQQQQTEARNAMAILFDAPPGKTMADPQRLPSGQAPYIATGLPAALLERRPDLKAAELRLRESLAESNATRASYLPTITLTGKLGTSSVALTDLLQNPIVALGEGVVLPFLDWQTMQKNVDVSKAEYEAAIVSYRQTVYQAFSDVENALSARTNDETQRDAYEKALENANQAEGVYKARYETGYAALQDWLDAQEKTRTARTTLLATRYDLWTNYVTLCLALGGTPLTGS